MKCAPQSEQLRCIARAGMALHPVEEGNKNLLHAPAGEAFLRTEQLTDDESLLAAVRWHTTGRAGMQPLERVVYLADFISSDRDYPDVETVRSYAEQSLEQAMLYTLRFTIPRCLARGLLLHPASVDLYNELLKGTNV